MLELNVLFTAELYALLTLKSDVNTKLITQCCLKVLIYGPLCVSD